MNMRWLDASMIDVLLPLGGSIFLLWNRSCGILYI